MSSFEHKFVCWECKSQIVQFIEMEMISQCLIYWDL